MGLPSEPKSAILNFTLFPMDKEFCIVDYLSEVLDPTLLFPTGRVLDNVPFTEVEIISKNVLDWLNRK